MMFVSAHQRQQKQTIIQQKKANGLHRKVDQLEHNNSLSWKFMRRRIVLIVLLNDKYACCKIRLDTVGLHILKCIILCNRKKTKREN